MWPLPTQQQLDETLRRQSLIVNYLTTDNEYLISVVRASFTAPSQQMGDRTLPPLEHCSVQQTSLPAAMANRCRQNRFDKGEKTKSRWSSFAEGHGQSSPTLQLEQKWLLPGLIDRTLNHWARSLPLDGGDGNDDADTDTAIPDDNDDDFASLTSEQSTSLQHSSPSLCPLALHGQLAFSLMFQGEDPGVCSGVIADSLAIERASCCQCASGVVSLCLSFSSDGHHRSHSCLGTFMPFGIQNTFVIIVHLWSICIRDTFGFCVFASATFLVCSLVKRSLHPCTDYFVNDSKTGDPQLVAEPSVGRNHGWAMGKS